MDYIAVFYDGMFPGCGFFDGLHVTIDYILLEQELFEFPANSAKTGQSTLQHALKISVPIFGVHRNN